MIHTGKRLESMWWGMVPALLTLLLAILCLVPKHLPGLNGFMPLLPLISIFYWGLAQPRMAYWVVFSLGLLQDAGSGQPLGTNGLLYLFFLGVLQAQRRIIYKEGFIIKWGYFALLLAALAGLHWLLLSLFNGQLQDGALAFLQWLLTVACYPLFHRGFDWLYAYMAARKWKLLHGH